MIVDVFPCEASERTRQVQELYLHDKNFISGVAPNFKFLIVSFGVLCDAHGAHLRQESEKSTPVEPFASWSFLERRPKETYSERVFEAVRRSLFVTFAALLPPLAEQQRLLVQEQVPLHGLEAGQVLDLCMAFFMLRPNTEGALHQQTAQLGQVTLKKKKSGNILEWAFCRFSDPQGRSTSNNPTMPLKVLQQAYLAHPC